MAEQWAVNPLTLVRFQVVRFLYRITLFDNKHYILSISLFYLSEYSHLAQTIEIIVKNKLNEFS